jgi:acyl transferase domain-containing protein
MTAAMSDLGVLSPDGSCKTFSADANGYARGEGINAIFIKPLEAALRDGNPIRAVIRATSSNNDGRTPGIVYPSADAHEALIRRAYEVAGIHDLSQTAFMECHGTGTLVGDPTETTAVGRVFGPTGGIYIGSVKPNMGHSEGASGITSLIKAVLSLEHLVIPPNIKFTTPNPAIPFESARLVVPTEPTPWPKSRAERVSVNSFGIGGSNAHVIVDSARSLMRQQTPIPTLDSPTPQLLLYSANTQESLKAVVANYQKYVDENPDNINDLSYTLCNRREHLLYRAFSVEWTSGLASVSVPSKSTTDAPALVMVFTGQGAQWPQMGRELMRWDNNHVFKDTIRILDRYLQSITVEKPDWSLEAELLKPARSSRLDTALVSQPACTAIQIALVDTLASIGVKPAAVVGHSSGEIAAAYAVGSLTAKEAITIAFYRGLVTTHQTKQGAMAAVSLESNTARQYLIPGVIIACENSPKSVTLSGDSDKIKTVITRIQAAHPDILVRLLKVDKAYHSHHMMELGQEYQSLIDPQIICKHPSRPFFSSVNGKAIDDCTRLDSSYWRQNLESPVLFQRAVTELLQHPVAENAVFLEVGPHSALSGPTRQIQESTSRSMPYVSVMVRGQNCVESFLTAMGKLHLLSIPLDFSKLVPTGSTLPDLPRYPWNHSERYWYESRLSKEWRQRQFPHHDLLGVRVTESTDVDPSWRNLLYLDNVPWIRDHKIKDDIVFPFAGYVSMAGEAVRQMTRIEDGFNVRHVRVNTALVLPEGKPIEIITSLRRHQLTSSLDSQWWDFTIASHNGNVWTKHCDGQVTAPAEATGLKSDLLIDPDMRDYPRKLSSRKFFTSVARAGLRYGPEFQLLEDIHTGAMKQVATAKSPNRRRDKMNYHIHPILIDSSFQILTAAATRGCRSSLAMILPTRVDFMSIRNVSSDITTIVSASYTSRGAILGEARSYAADNKAAVLSISGMRMSVLEDPARTPATARLYWGPHIDFMRVHDLIKPSVDRVLYTPTLTELTHLCVVYSQRRLQGLNTDIPYMEKFRDWISRQAASNKICLSLSTAGDDELIERAGKLVEQLSTTGGTNAATAMYKILTNISSIFTGKVGALEVLLANDTLARLYNFMDECDRSLFLQHLAHSKPNLRILEIGAGTGATTASMLKDLVLPDGSGQVLYSQYTYTDISPSFFVAARERFKAAVNMEFMRLDISQDPAEQGFDGRQYDLVVATNVIHATPSLQVSLSHIRSMLAPDGRLLLLDLDSQSKWVNFVFGTLEGWWYGLTDGRCDEPYISPERWVHELKEAGFRDPDAIVLDAPAPFQMNAIMVARPAEAQPRSRSTDVTVLCDGSSIASDAVINQLKLRGYTVHLATLDEAWQGVEHDVVALLDENQPFFEGINECRFNAFKRLVTQLSEDAGVFWVTQPCQVNVQDPRYAQVLGLARTIRNELGIHFATCEVDDLQESAAVVSEAFTHFHNRDKGNVGGVSGEEGRLDPEYEYAVYNQQVLVSRYLPFSLEDEQLTFKKDDEITLEISRPGRLSSLHWIFSERSAQPLGDDAVEVEIYSSGLNFRVRCSTFFADLALGIFRFASCSILCLTLTREILTSVRMFSELWVSWS